MYLPEDRRPAYGSSAAPVSKGEDGVGRGGLGHRRVSRSDMPLKRRARTRWYTAAPVVLLASFFLLAGLAEAVPRIVHADTAITSLGLTADILFDPPLPPTPSGVEPAYPLNHTMDGDPTTLGQPQNADFETPPSSVGSPPTNADIESSPVDVVTVPNGDFQTGTFANWTLTGSPTIQSDQTHGYWARMGSNGQEITSSALAIPSTAQSVLADVYFQGANSWWEVYALSGPTFGTSTQLTYEYCSGCGWQLRYVDISAYRGQTIKLKFRARYSPVGIDNVKVQQVFPGYDSGGIHARLVSGSDHYASLGASSWIATDAFALDETAQSGTVEVKGAAANSQYSIKIATGPGYGNWTTLSSGVAPSSWETKTFNIAPYAGQQVKVKVTSEYNVTYFDDILGSQTTDIPGWAPTGTTSRVTDGSNHYVSNSGTLTSAPVQVPAGTQNATFRMRSSGAGTGMTIDALYGSGYAQTQQLGFLMLPSSWTTIKVGIGAYAGQTVRLRLTKSFANPAFHLDDAGVFENVLDGWTPTTLDPLDTGQDAYGTYAKGYGATAPIFVRSSWVSPGIIDRQFVVDARYYAISYALAANDLLQVFWVDEQEDSTNVFQDASGGWPTGYETSWFDVPEFLRVVPSRDSIFQFARQLAGKYGFSVHF
jgi:hypothetical protein